MFACVDCGVDTREIKEYYMVHDLLWNLVGMSFKDGMLCVGCLEKRLGRELRSSDFTHAPINWDQGNYQSDRLRRRLGYEVLSM